MSHGMQVASGRWRSKETDALLELPEETSPATHIHLSLVTLHLDFQDL